MRLNRQRNKFGRKTVSHSKRQGDLMYLHLGNEQVILTKKIIGIFDIENTSVSKNTKDFLYSAEKKSLIIPMNLENFLHLTIPFKF